MGTDEQATQQTRVWLSLAALEDAVHHIKQQPLDSLCRVQLDVITTHIYLLAGLKPEEATLLYGESIDRHADRLKVVFQEVSR